MHKLSSFISKLKNDEIEYIDFKFTDLLGKWNHITYHSSAIDEDLLERGFVFDASSLQGWKPINDSDMLLVPDLNTVSRDPFASSPTLSVICDVVDPANGQPYSKDPRSIARAAERYMRDSGIADHAFFGPEPEFFIFDKVSYRHDPYMMSVSLENEELPCSAFKPEMLNQMGHFIPNKRGYAPVSPMDAGQDLRNEMLSCLANLNVIVEKHHHEVASGQHELGIKYASLLQSSDNIQILKYVVHNVAISYSKSATFLPKPVFSDNGSGMHVHQSLWKQGTSLFKGAGYAGLSDLSLWYLGGVLKHARALNAFTNPTTNSYKRLVAGFEAPVVLAYSAKNRSAACRIPTVTHENARRIEVRFPDPKANPYLAFAAMLMAGIDGILNKISPSDPIDYDLYADVHSTRHKHTPCVAASLDEALDALNEDRAFLKAGGVFADDMLDSYIELKRAEALQLKLYPHPIEFVNDYTF